MNVEYVAFSIISFIQAEISISEIKICFFSYLLSFIFLLFFSFSPLTIIGTSLCNVLCTIQECLLLSFFFFPSIPFSCSKNYPIPHILKSDYTLALRSKDYLWYELVIYVCVYYGGAPENLDGWPSPCTGLVVIRGHAWKGPVLLSFHIAIPPFLSLSPEFLCSFFLSYLTEGTCPCVP